MSRVLRRADDFLGDFDHQYQWYLVEAGETVAGRYLDAVWRALEELAAHPGAWGGFVIFDILPSTGCVLFAFDRPSTSI